MKEADRKLMRRRLDVEMRPFRRASAVKDATQGLLRAVGLAMRIPSLEIAVKMGIRQANVFQAEEREENGTIGMLALSRAAEAMGAWWCMGLCHGMD